MDTVSRLSESFSESFSDSSAYADSSADADSEHDADSGSSEEGAEPDSESPPEEPQEARAGASEPPAELSLEPEPRPMPEAVTGLPKLTGFPVAVRNATDRIWRAISTAKGKERQSRKEIASALAAAVKKGHALGHVEIGVIGYLGGESATKAAGEFQAGLHLVIREERWLVWYERHKAAQGQPSPLRPAAPADPAQRSDADWRQSMEIYKIRFAWPDALGPRPGAPGCLVPAQILRDFEEEPYEDRIARQARAQAKAQEARAQEAKAQEEAARRAAEAAPEKPHEPAPEPAPAAPAPAPAPSAAADDDDWEFL